MNILNNVSIEYILNEKYAPSELNEENYHHAGSSNGNKNALITDEYTPCIDFGKINRWMNLGAKIYIWITAEQNVWKMFGQ